MTMPVVAVGRLAGIWSSKFGQLTHKINDSASKQRLPPSQPDFCDSHSYEDARHPQIVREGQISVKSAFVTCPTINTLVVAAVGDRYPQVSNAPAEFVGKSQ